MSQFLRKPIISRTISLVTLQNPNARSLKMRWFSASLDHKIPSFTVSYFINSLGFSPQSALSASKRVSFKTSAKPDKAIGFFKSHGFSQTQITRLVRAMPKVLVNHTERTLLPKLEFLKSKGLSDPEIAKTLSSFPNVLGANLANRIIPSYEFYRNLFQSDKEIIGAVRRYPDILSHNIKSILSNIDTLREHGAPESVIFSLFKYSPRCFVSSHDRFRRVVEELSKMGFNTSTSKFGTAMIICLGISEEKRKSKVDLYSKFGLSEEEVSRAFRSDPRFVSRSEGKISAVMGFFADEMNWSPSFVAKYPVVMGLSFKKRIVPRCLVFKALISKGLFKKRFEKKNVVNLSQLLGSSEEIFLKKYVEAYEKEAPELLRFYREKLVAVGL